MKTRVILLIGVYCVVLAVIGCYPDDLPSYIDERTVIAVGACASMPVIWKVDVKDKTVTTQPLTRLMPTATHPSEARMIGGLLWGDGNECFDPVKDRFIQLENPPPEGILYATPASIDGKKSLLFEIGESNNRTTYGVYSFPELKKQKEVVLGEVQAAGDFWWVDVEGKRADRDMVIEKVHVHDSTGKLVVTIPAEETTKAGFSSFEYAHVNSKEKVILLAWGSFNHLFGVFDLGTGKFLWGGHSGWGRYEGCVGHPLVKRDEVWYLERKHEEENTTVPSSQRTGHKPMATVLVRYRSGGPATTRPVREEAELPYPYMGQFSISPDESQFLAVEEMPPCKLLLIPIRLGITEKDVVSIELKPTTRPAPRSATLPAASPAPSEKP